MIRTELELIEDFVKQKKFAIVGVSRKKEKFGNYIFRELCKRNYIVFPVNPNVDKIDGHQCYGNLRDLPEKVDGVIVVVPPPQAERIVDDIASGGISRVWLQQGSESDESVVLCRKNDIRVVAGKCIMMFAPPVKSFHLIHRFFWYLFSGKSKV